MSMTNEEPGICPFCKSEEVIYGSIDIDGLLVKQECSCFDCEASWVDIYRFERYERTN